MKFRIRIRHEWDWGRFYTPCIGIDHNEDGKISGIGLCIGFYVVAIVLFTTKEDSDNADK